MKAEELQSKENKTTPPAVNAAGCSVDPGAVSNRSRSAATSERQLHLINAIRVWLNRAISHAENGNSDKAESAVRSAREVLAALETICR